MSPAPARLVALVAAVRRHLRRRGAVAAGLWTAAGVALCLLGAWLLSGGEGWRQGSEGPAIVDLTILLLVASGIVAYRRASARWFDEPPLADSMERVAGLESGTVRGSLELARALPAGVSASLAARAAARALGDLNRSPRELSGTLGEEVGRWTRRGMGVLTALAVVLTALALAAPARTSAAWRPLAAPVRTMIDPVLPAVTVSPGDVEVLRGTDVRVDVDAPGRESSRLLWQAAGDVARTLTLPLVEGRGGYQFRDVSAPIEYRVRAPDGVETRRYRIVPIDPLFVSDLVVSAEYPPHTGLPPDEFRGDPPPLRLPEGTLLRIEGRATRTLSVAEVVDSAGRVVVRLGSRPAEGGGRVSTFDAAWRPRASGTYGWLFLDDDGAPAEIAPAPLRLTMVADSVPSVTIPLPGRDTILPMSLRQPLVIEARDDYGLSVLELVAFRVTAFGERMEPVVQRVDLGGTRSALARPLLDVSGWGLMPGDTVRYLARAVDNAPSPGTAATREYVLRMPAAGEMQRAAEAQMDEVASRLEEIAAEAARQAQENRDRARAESGRTGQPNNPVGDPTRTQAEPGFETREEMRRALEDQRGLTGDVDSLRAELEALQRALEEAGQADPELARDLKELQDLLERVAGEDLRERLDELSRALDEEDMRQASESLQDLAREQEGFRDRLEESLERFRRAAVEQDFRATTSEAEELARQEQALADAMREEGAPEPRAAQQDQLQQRATELESSMEQLAERLRRIEEPEAAQRVDDAGRQASQSREEMRQSAEQSRRGQDQQAAQQASEAAQSMQEAARELAEAQEQMNRDEAAAAEQALRQSADDALALARRQAELREEMRGATQEQTAAMRSDEASLLQGVRNLAQNLQSATGGSTGGNQDVSAQAGRAMESLQRTIESMEGRRGSTPSPSAMAEQAVADLNQLALSAMAQAEMMAQGQGQGQSGQQVTEQLEQLAQQQGELNSQTSQLMPLQLGQQAMAQQLQQLAQGQQSVAGDLGRLADEPGAEEQALGDLNALAEEARALTDMMAQGRLTPDVVRRQERLFHRLLDAGRSLEREEFSDERESRAPGEVDRPDVLPLAPGQLGVLRYRLPSAEELQGLSPAVRQLVIEYFERLNRDSGARPPGAPGGGGAP